jgi:flagellar hook-basal body complex protein FliE
VTIEAVGAIAVPQIAAPDSTAVPATSGTPRVDFGAMLDRELSALNAQLGTAEQSLTQLASGESGNLHRVMLDIEQARLSFQLAVQVRNKLLESYQDLMRMQI